MLNASQLDGTEATARVRSYSAEQAVEGSGRGSHQEPADSLSPSGRKSKRHLTVPAPATDSLPLPTPPMAPAEKRWLGTACGAVSWPVPERRSCGGISEAADLQPGPLVAEAREFHPSTTAAEHPVETPSCGIMEAATMSLTSYEGSEDGAFQAAASRADSHQEDDLLDEVDCFLPAPAPCAEDRVSRTRTLADLEADVAGFPVCEEKVSPADTHAKEVSSEGSRHPVAETLLENLPYHGSQRRSASSSLDSSRSRSWSCSSRSRLGSHLAAARGGGTEEGGLGSKVSGLPQRVRKISPLSHTSSVDAPKGQEHEDTPPHSAQIAAGAVDESCDLVEAATENADAEGFEVAVLSATCSSFNTTGQSFLSAAESADLHSSPAGSANDLLMAESIGPCKKADEDAPTKHGSEAANTSDSSSAAPGGEIQESSPLAQRSEHDAFLEASAKASSSTANGEQQLVLPIASKGNDAQQPAKNSASAQVTCTESGLDVDDGVLSSPRQQQLDKGDVASSTIEAQVLAEDALAEETVPSRVQPPKLASSQGPGTGLEMSASTDAGASVLEDGAAPAATELAGCDHAPETPGAEVSPATVIAAPREDALRSPAATSAAGQTQTPVARAGAGTVVSCSRTAAVTASSAAKQRKAASFGAAERVPTVRATLSTRGSRSCSGGSSRASRGHNFSQQSTALQKSAKILRFELQPGKASPFSYQAPSRDFPSSSSSAWLGTSEDVSASSSSSRQQQQHSRGRQLQHGRVAVSSQQGRGSCASAVREARPVATAPVSGVRTGSSSSAAAGGGRTQPPPPSWSFYDDAMDMLKLQAGQFGSDDDS